MSNPAPTGRGTPAGVIAERNIGVMIRLARQPGTPTQLGATTLLMNTWRRSGWVSNERGVYTITSAGLEVLERSVAYYVARRGRRW